MNKIKHPIRYQIAYQIMDQICYRVWKKINGQNDYHTRCQIWYYFQSGPHAWDKTENEVKKYYK